jgi:transcription antitermination protein NusB
MLYQLETNGGDAVLALAKYCELFPYQEDIISYAREILIGVGREKPMIDGYLQTASEHWRLNRITHVDTNVLRIGAWEMLFSSDVPPKVAIDEAIELGKKYGNEDSKDFINGVLDRVLRDFYRRTGVEGSAGSGEPEISTGQDKRAPVQKRRPER